MRCLCHPCESLTVCAHVTRKQMPGPWVRVTLRLYDDNGNVVKQQMHTFEMMAVRNAGGRLALARQLLESGFPVDEQPRVVVQTLDMPAN